MNARKHLPAANAAVARSFFILLLVATVSLLSACDISQNSSQAESLRIGILPDHDEARLRARFSPLLDYLSTQAGMPYTLEVPSSYAELLDWFHQGRINLALFGGYTYVKAKWQDGAIPLVMRDVDGKFSSVVIVNKKINAKKLADLRSTRFSFGSPLSTSGHLMPRHFLQEQKIIPETYFKETRFSGAHDRTVLWVQSGKVDAGVANASIVREMYLDGRLDQDKVQVLWITPPYPDYVWAASPALSPDTRARLTRAFLALTPKEPRHQKILAKLGAGYYIAAKEKDFAMLEDVIRRTTISAKVK